MRSPLTGTAPSAQQQRANRAIAQTFKRSKKLYGSIKHFDFDIPIPNRRLRLSVEPLQTQWSLAGEVFKRLRELVFRAVRIFLCLGPVIEIHVQNFFPVKDEGNVA